MAILRIKNQSKYKISVPVVDARLAPYSTHDANVIDVDVFFNDPRIQDMMSSTVKHANPLISVTILQDSTPEDVTVSFESAWDTTKPLRLEPYQVWLDASGDMRVVNGIPSSDLDGTPVGKTSYTAEPIFSSAVQISSRSFATVRSIFLNRWRNYDMGTWDGLYKYCYWTFTYDNLNPWSDPQQFATENDMFLWMEANLPSSGGVYACANVKFKLFELVNPEDTFPNKVVHRNSLVASLAGRNRGVRKEFQYYGVSSFFNSPNYYTNFYNELGSRFVEAQTGVVPATNNDNCIWYPRSNRTMWQFPKDTVQIVSATRGAAWDSVTASWVSPAPTGYYQVQNPFMLYEYKRDRSLAIAVGADYHWRTLAVNAVCAYVFPVIESARYHGFVVVPYSGDSWSTEQFDTTQYEMVLKLHYRGSFRNMYRVIQPWPTTANNYEHFMWSHFDPTGAGSLLALKTEGGGALKSTDTNTVPSAVYMARRDKITGIRSKWRPVYNIKRRLKNADIRVMPTF